MKPGRVVKLRLNPQACMACVDIANKIGANREGMSFAQCVILALEGAIAAFKANGLIQERDGFEYSELMSPYHDQPHIDRARKLQITKFLENSHVRVATPTVSNPMKSRKRVRFEELAFKANNTPESMDEEEQAELQRLVLELNP